MATTLFDTPKEMKEMATVTAIHNIDSGLTDTGPTPTRQSFRRWTAGLFLSAVVGGISGLGGLVLGVMTMGELIVPSTSLYAISTVLIGVSFIFFGLAAHCLDKSDAVNKALRMDYCRQHGLKDDDYYRRLAKSK